MPNWNSIYSATAPITAPRLKELAAEAGVHIYDRDPSHLLFANRHYVVVASNAEGGQATIRLPQAATVVDLLSGETTGVAIGEWTLPLRPKEVRLFELKQRP